LIKRSWFEECGDQHHQSPTRRLRADQTGPDLSRQAGVSSWRGRIRRNNRRAKVMPMPPRAKWHGAWSITDRV